MLNKKLANHNLILASGSPRRHTFFKILDLEFEVRLHPVEEIYPKQLVAEEITDYLAKLKAEPLKTNLKPNDILITSDTIVWHNHQPIGKPKNEADAFKMIKALSNSTHEVISSIAITQVHQQKIVNTKTKVKFRDLTDNEIQYYVSKYKPLDKAGAYGIQEWIGAVAITDINGSYNNVVGLPTHLLYEVLNDIAER